MDPPLGDCCSLAGDCVWRQFPVKLGLARVGGAFINSKALRATDWAQNLKTFRRIGESAGRFFLVLLHGVRWRRTGCSGDGRRRRRAPVTLALDFCNLFFQGYPVRGLDVKSMYQ